MIGLMTMLKSASIYLHKLERKCRLDYLATGLHIPAVSNGMKNKLEDKRTSTV
ncbi:hypothetical protein PO124_31290 [Bacillus licheniformis]|nr:hypothetical protein [Bacillus licheniformis]